MFGGQGASNLYSPRALCKVRESTRTCKTALSLLSRCHAAFIDELQSMDQRTKDRLAIDPDRFCSPQDLLSLDASLQSHSLIQMIVIVLAQLLHYAAEIESHPGSFDTYLEQVLEVDGFCSGLLTAAVVASSSDEAMFSFFGVQAFRLAFWLGCRSFLQSQSIEPVRSDGSTWSLVVIGLGAETVLEELRQYKSIHNGCRICVSAISSETVVSLTGPTQELVELKRNLTAPMTKFANVQSWYHGGENLTGIFDEILKDQQRRNITFPNLKDLIVPLRSSRNGLLIEEDSSNTSSLSEVIIQNILLHPIDWVSTATKIVNSINSCQGGVETWRGEIISFGPSSESLFAELRTRATGKNISFMDLSPFKTGDEIEVGRNDIAIIGMGVHFPKGNGQERLWETLSMGLNAVSKVRQYVDAISNIAQKVVLY